MINKRKEKEKKIGTCKDRTWKAVGASNIIYKPNLKSRRRRKKEDIECLQSKEEWEKLKKNERNW